MNKKLLISSVSAALSVLPIAALAIQIQQGEPPIQTSSLNFLITGILQVLFPVFLGLAAIMFVIAAYLYLTAQGDPDKLKTARDVVIWSVVALILGLVSLSIGPVAVQLFTGGGT